MKLTALSAKRLEGLDTRLVAVVKRAAELTTQDFQVVEGLRTLSRQRELVKKGASKTLRSRHLTGHAVDLVAKIGGRDSWEFPLFGPIADAMFAAAKELGIRIRWGADWDSDGNLKEERFVDTPHFEMPRQVYGNVRVAAPDAPALTAAIDTVSDKAEAAAARTLALGDRGRPVFDLQADLETLGLFPSPIDGVFGQVTASAVKAFQAEQGLKPDAVVGPRTRAALAGAVKAARK